MKWNIILNSLDGNKVVNPGNNPKLSGEYLCTCIFKTSYNEYHRYLRMMKYDSNIDRWSDLGIGIGISHIILAWADIPVCDFPDFKCHGGTLFES